MRGKLSQTQIKSLADNGDFKKPLQRPLQVLQTYWLALRIGRQIIASL